ncbi:TIGR02234 family membrane protein [Streptomyces sp. Je 1-4]|uniref:TIGR02234 family membrane protein n=1 Tax=unclassified Streptomyces TaxID=2593676 RepID=UPI0021D801A9|nr:MULTISPECIES: TIGR02234 family membrane protein [unclassified Streptomyces]UYB44980.1 TIGR02234 family membrane protein [Streptomyces sp. Je 1-4]UZQ39312.1 TIGR02234 family membrane protein [Streptomyces sp. Je 1-4] [Streptomyces sp. Je 1-4 4N24]UZQ46729.1 TIGR02234 family membrane protein [Streptomyces sp. Je 1-4] [Streptomyces sp. Je 1-4 4N24_ara]
MPPGDSGPAPARPVRRAHRSLALALLAGAAGAALALLASGRTWAEGSAVLAQGELPRTVTGADVTGVPGALAVVGLAALVAVFAVRRAGRIAVAGLLTLSGVGVAVAAVLGNSDTSALREKAATAVGMTGTGVHHVTHTGWPWVAAAGGLLLLVAGLLALVHGRHWPAMSGRYERTPGGARGPRRAPAAPDLDRPEEIWKSLDRGEDPTR